MTAATSAEQLSLFDDAPHTAAIPRIRRSRRARRLILQVMHDGSAELVVPHATTAPEISAFLYDHREWLANAVDQQVERFGAVDSSMPEALELEAVGERWQIQRQYRSGHALRTSVRPGSGPTQFVLRLSGDNAIPQARLKAAVRQQLVARARSMYLQLLTPLAGQMGARFSRLQVRNQKTCWGSYSGRGTISMNYAGVFLKPSLVHYLCVHELAHSHHMDHSRAFWKRVEQFVPDARAVDRELGGTHRVLPAWLW
ncbi:MAG: YgjP-like metallopeptidase domain-containing protein [Pseudomonadota bacterium]